MAHPIEKALDVLSAPCPTCAALPGRRCTAANGAERSAVHQERLAAHRRANPPERLSMWKAEVAAWRGAFPDYQYNPDSKLIQQNPNWKERDL